MVDQFGRWYPDYPGQQPYMDPQYLRSAGQSQQTMIQPQPAPVSNFQNGSSQPIQQSAPQMMTPPTIHAEIVQIDGEAAIAQFPVNVGASQMMMAKDDSFIAVKTMLANGQYTVDFYDKRPPAPPEPVFDPTVYVRRDEIEGLIAAAVAAVQPANLVAKREEAEA